TAPSTRWKKWARNLGSPASVSARLRQRHCGSCGILAAAASYERFSPTSRQTTKRWFGGRHGAINQREQRKCNLFKGDSAAVSVRGRVSGFAENITAGPTRLRQSAKPQIREEISRRNCLLEICCPPPKKLRQTWAALAPSCSGIERAPKELSRPEKAHNNWAPSRPAGR